MWRGLSTEKTELIFSQTSWLQYGNELFNSDESVSSISTFGFSQRVSESGVLGIGVMSMDFGDIEITTVDMPDGGIGTFSPSFMNIGFPLMLMCFQIVFKEGLLLE